jgi:hypothetical protein
VLLVGIAYPFGSSESLLVVLMGASDPPVESGQACEGEAFLAGAKAGEFDFGG